MSTYHNIIDSHAHYDDKQYDNDRHEVLINIHDSGVSSIVNCSSDLSSIDSTIALAKKYDYVYPALGLHPLDIDGLNQADVLAMLSKKLTRHNAVAVGEIGLDYYYDDVAPHPVQRDWFIKQIELAKSLDLPVIVHDRESHQDILDILKAHRPKGVLHCFSGSAEMAIEFVKLGFYIGVGGTVTFKNARRPVEVAEVVPLDRLLLETDAPYLSPHPMRGKRNLSSYISYTAEKIAQLRSIDTQELIDITAKNAQTLFGF